jgi:hypothetical protein
MNTIDLGMLKETSFLVIIRNTTNVPRVKNNKGFNKFNNERKN